MLYGVAPPLSSILKGARYGDLSVERPAETWEIEPRAEGFCRLTVTHELEGALLMEAAISSKFNGRGGGGWTWVISDLKSLLETGKPPSG